MNIHRYTLWTTYPTIVSQYGVPSHSWRNLPTNVRKRIKKAIRRRQSTTTIAGRLYSAITNYLPTQSSELYQLYYGGNYVSHTMHILLYLQWARVILQQRWKNQEGVYKLTALTIMTHRWQTSTLLKT